MNIRLIKKSMMMVPFILVVTAVIAFGADHREGIDSNGTDPRLSRNMNLLQSFLQGGGDGFILLNETPQMILCAEEAMPAVCVSVINLSAGPMQLGNMNMDNPRDMRSLGMIGAGQTKTFCVPAGPNGAFLGLMQSDGGGGGGLALYNVAYPTIPN